LASRRGALPAAQLKSFLEVALAVPTAEAADFLFSQASETAAETGLLESSATHAARYSTARQLDALATFSAKKFETDLGRQASLLRAVQTGLRQRKTELAIEPGPARDWALALAAQLLDPKKQPSPPWANQPLDSSVSAKPSPSPWGVRIRKCADGQDAQVFDSIVGGETLTGVLRSAPFLIPAQLTFWLCGHNGFPDKNPPPVNHIRLRLVDSGEIVAKQIPPRNDTAQKIVWDLKESAGRRGVIEIVDADSGTAYAWIGAGRFEPSVVAAPSAGFGADFNAFDVALQVVEAFKSKEHLPAVDRLIGDGQVSGAVRSQALQTEFAVDRAAVLPRLPELLNSAAEPAVLRAKAAELLAALQTDEARKQLAAAIATVPSALQNSIALSLASTTDGAEVLLATIAAGKASPRLLQDKPILDRLASVSLKDREQRVAELTKSLPPADERAKQLITQRLQGYAVAEKSLEQGAAAFKKNCAVCHKAKGEGAMIGPQLDGIASRGVERLVEDIVDPNRNVDAAFRTLIVTTTGGQVITGLKLREEGQTLVLADNQGKEVRVPMSEIEEQRQSSLSLMPANLVDTLPEADFYHVLTYLSQLRSSSAPK
ncbi:MAG TPA: c-type cytochrome, partial [Pirellulaceae bacterium]|nr:c-type cytochrome [Pirellulaceae bacterium]